MCRRGFPVIPRIRPLGFLGLLLLLTVPLLSGCGFSDSSGEDWLRYRDEESGFEVRHPASWSPAREAGPNDVLFTHEGEDAENRPACSVKRQPSRGLTDDQLPDVGKTFIQTTKRRAKGFRVHSKGPAPVGSDTGYAVTWSFLKEGNRMVLQQRYTLGSDQFAVLSCGDRRPRYDDREPLYDRFFKSFRWLESEGP